MIKNCKIANPISQSAINCYLIHNNFWFRNLFKSKTIENELMRKIEKIRLKASFFNNFNKRFETFGIVAWFTSKVETSSLLFAHYKNRSVRGFWDYKRLFSDQSQKQWDGKLLNCSKYHLNSLISNWLGWNWLPNQT